MTTRRDRIFSTGVMVLLQLAALAIAAAMIYCGYHYGLKF